MFSCLMSFKGHIRVLSKRIKDGYGLKCANYDFKTLNTQSQKQRFVLFVKTESFFISFTTFLQFSIFSSAFRATIGQVF